MRRATLYPAVVARAIGGAAMCQLPFVVFSAHRISASKGS